MVTAVQTQRKRFLTRREADRCEQAKEPVCHCRCGGLKHGAKRVSGDELASLPLNDPHYVPEYSRQDILRILRNARDKIGIPETSLDRDDALAQDRFNDWVEERGRDLKGTHDAREIIEQAIKRIKMEGLTPESSSASEASL